MSRDVGGQMRFDGTQEPEKKAKPRPKSDGPVEPLHRVFNLTTGEDSKYWLPANQFTTRNNIDKPLVQEDRPETPL